MKDFLEQSQLQFSSIGINHHNSPVHVRERFALTDNEIQALLQESKNMKINGMLVISTCNRTEMYSFSEKTNELIELLLKYCKGTMEEFEHHGFQLTNYEAIMHLFSVGVGLDSQILGDYQVIGQVKASYKLSVEADMMPPVFSRMMQYVFQASREVKNNTELSTGSASVATYAAKYIEKYTKKTGNSKILLYGLGKIGISTVQNLMRSKQKYKISIVNRTFDKSQEIATKYNLRAIPVAQLAQEINDHNILVVSTGAPHYTINKELAEHFKTDSVILDLSIPRNVDPALSDFTELTIIEVDEISQQKSETLKTREKHIHKAQQIISKKIEDYNNWLSVNSVSPLFNELRKKLYKYKQTEIRALANQISDTDIDCIDQVSNNVINKIIQNFLILVRKHPEMASDIHTLIKQSFNLKSEN